MTQTRVSFKANNMRENVNADEVMSASAASLKKAKKCKQVCLNLY